jgi:hypothetical protein
MKNKNEKLHKLIIEQYGKSLYDKGASNAIVIQKRQKKARRITRNNAK